MQKETDPILIKRAKIATIVSSSLRSGHALYLASFLVLLISFFTTFTTISSYLIIGFLIVGSFLLAPAYVFKYAIKAADKADKEDSW